MLSLLLTLLVAAPLPPAGLASPPIRLEYLVRLVDPAAKRLEVELIIDGPDRSLGELHLLPAPAFRNPRTPHPLEDFSARTAANESAAWSRNAASGWEVRATDSLPINVSWSVSLTRREAETAHHGTNQFQMSYVEPDHAMLCTEELFLYPDDRDSERIDVRFELPEGWAVTAPWSEAQPETYRPSGPTALISDVLAVGSWTVQHLEAGALDLAIAIAPGQERLEEICAEDFTRILAHELELFGRAPCERYLFVFGRADVTGIGGSPRTSSMTMFVHPTLLPEMRAGLLSILAHEFHHVWVNERIAMPDELRWMNEGFTDYFAHLVCARLGITTWEELAGALGGRAASCETNPRGGAMSLTEAGGQAFFRDPNASDLVYHGGWLLAAWLDRALRESGPGRSLEAFLRHWVNDPRWDDSPRSPTTLEDFIATLRSYAGEELAAALDGHARRPFDFDPVAAFAERGVAIERTLVPPSPDLQVRMDGTRVTLVQGSSLAQRIGLRAGDFVREANGIVPEDESDVREAWPRLVDDRLMVTVERKGERVVLDRKIPPEPRYRVPVDPFRE